MGSSGAIDTWIRSERSRTTVALKRLYELQAEFLFNQYEPVKATPAEAGLPFIDRLDRWIGSFDDPEDQWTVFTTFKYFFFAGLEETDEMYRCAVQHILVRWLIDLGGIDIFSQDGNQSLSTELKACWPCPVTDSLRINSLLHRTGFEGQSLRPDWLSMKTLGDAEKIGKYVTKKGIRYLVLFEDFSGTGNQCDRAARYALNIFPGPILLVPLVICAPGEEKLRKLEAESNGRLTFRPVIVLGYDCLVGRDAREDQPKSFIALRQAMHNGYKKMKSTLDGEEFGYGSVGSLYSSFSNCPNNNPPIYHGNSPGWSHALFPRKRRA